MEHEYLYRESEEAILILSVMDVLEIGSESELGGEFSGKKVRIFARKILINGRVECGDLLLSAEEISSSGVGDIYLSDRNEPEACLDIYAAVCKDIGKKIQVHVGGHGNVRILTTGPYRRAMLFLAEADDEGYYCNLLDALCQAADADEKVKESIYKKLWELYDGYDPDNEYPATVSGKEQYSQMFSGICGDILCLYNQSEQTEQKEMKQELEAVLEQAGRIIGSYDAVYEERLMHELVRSDRVRTSVCDIRQVDDRKEAAGLALFPIVHPVQTRMLLEKCKLNFAVNSVVDQKHELYNEMLSGFLEVRNQAEIFRERNAELETLYEKRKEELFYTFIQEDTLHLFDESSVYIARLSQGYDYFGKKEIWAPRGSFSMYQSQMDKMLLHFKNVEEEYRLYLDKNQSQREKLSKLRQEESQECVQQSNALRELKELQQRQESTRTRIEQLGRELEEKRTLLAEGLQQIEDLIQNSFGCSAEDIISAIAMCAFAPGSKLLVGSQIVDLAAKGFTTAVGASGIHVKKKYLIKKVVHCSNDVKEFITSYRELKDGTLQSDRQSENRILMDDEDMMSLFGMLDDIFPDEISELKKQFKKFSDMVVEQNQKILEYNEYLWQIQEKKANADCHESNRRMLQTLLRENVDPELPQIRQFMSAIYTETQRKILFEMYKECKAFYYWSANEITSVSEALVRYKPYELSSAVFEKIQTDLLAEQNEIIERRGICPSGERGQGIKIEYSLLENGRNDLVEKLKKEYTVSFQIEEATVKSTLEENPFAGKAEVRLLKLAIQAIGAEAESAITVDAVHFGEEVIYDKYARRIRFSHDEIKGCSEYDGKRITYIQYDDKEHTYALISPFAFWTLSLDKKKHKKLNLEKLEDVRMTFYVTCVPFEDGAGRTVEFF